MSSCNSFNNLTDDQRQTLYHELLRKSENGKLPKRTMKDFAGHYAVSKKSISRTLHLGTRNVEQGSIFEGVSSRKKTPDERRNGYRVSSSYCQGWYW